MMFQQRSYTGGLQVHHLCLNMMLVLDWIQFSLCNHYYQLLIIHMPSAAHKWFIEKVGLSTPE